MPEPPNKDYRRWPENSEERTNLARDLFGVRLMSVRDGGVANAYRVIFKNRRLKVPSPEVGEAYEWLDNLSDSEKQILLNLIADSIDLALYGLMCEFDGVGGHIIHDGFAEVLKLSLDITKRSDTGHIQEGEIEESFSLKDPRKFYYYHWHEWMEKFSTAGNLIHPVTQQLPDEPSSANTGNSDSDTGNG